MTRHEHLHLFADGLRRLIHAHPYPVNEQDPLAARPHRHVNGRHRHPHGHAGYAPLPAGETRRPIVQVGAA